MSQTEATRQSDFILPPMASNVAGAAGKVAMSVVATSTVVASLDLTTVPGLPDTYPGSVASNNPNPLGHYVTIYAESADAYVVFGKAQANVIGANAPNPTQAGTNVAGLCTIIPAGQERAFKLPLGDNASSVGANGGDSPCRWLGVITKTGTGFIRLWQSSP